MQIESKLRKVGRLLLGRYVVTCKVAPRQVGRQLLGTKVATWQVGSYLVRRQLLGRQIATWYVGSYLVGRQLLGTQVATWHVGSYLVRMQIERINTVMTFLLIDHSNTLSPHFLCFCQQKVGRINTVPTFGPPICSISFF